MIEQRNEAVVKKAFVSLETETSNDGQIKTVDAKGVYFRKAV